MIISLALLLLVCPACTTYYYVVRHAEKADSSTDPPLSATGQQRALALRDTLAGKGIDSIFTTGFQRTQQTARPLATLLGEGLQIHTGSTDSLIRALKKISGKEVLVVGHSNTIPEIVQGLSGSSVGAIAENDFDNLYIIRVKKCINTRRTVRHITYGAPSP